VNPDGLERHDRLMSDYGELVDQCLRGKQPVLPSTLARALAGGVHRTVDSYVRTGRTDELLGLAPELARWIRSYHPVPSGLATDVEPSPSWTCVGSNGLVGRRAPGTLTLAPDGYQPPLATRSSGFIHHSNRERILDAVAQLVSARDYTTLTAQSIAEHADLSERAFLAHFKNKHDAFTSTVEVGHMKGQAIVERARARSPDWRTGVRQAIYALLEFLASEPHFTRLTFVEAPLAGPTMTRRTHEHAGAYARLLLDGAPRRRRPAPIAPEAAVHGLFELAFHHAAQDNVAELLTGSAREAAYLTLAPFVGATDAVETAV
jgi:AcrR family transcriptional regulator